MPRDLFAETLNHRAGPRRSKWTIAGSVLAHIRVVAALAVIPLMSLLDDVVIHASDLMYNAPPIVMPVTASPPPPKTAAPTPAVNPKAAPSQPSQDEVTKEPPELGPPGPPSTIINPNRGPGFPSGDRGPLRVDDVVVAPPPPQVKTPVPVGGDIKPPARTYYVDPVYPSVAVSVKQEGMVILEATIDESGTVKNLKVLRSVPLLDKAAIEAVSKWRYMPTKLNGVPVPVLLTVTVTFALR